MRITTNLVQIDVGVTKDGKPVAGLRPEDFEIFEDGKPQTSRILKSCHSIRNGNHPKPRDFE